MGRRRCKAEQESHSGLTPNPDCPAEGQIQAGPLSDHLPGPGWEGPPGTQDTSVPASSLLGSVRQGPREPLAPPAPHAFTHPTVGTPQGSVSLSAVSCCPLLGWGEALSPGVAGDAAGWERSPRFPPVTERRGEPG